MRFKFSTLIRSFNRKKPKVLKNFHKVRRFCLKHKVFTYAGLLFLTIQNYQLRQQNNMNTSLIDDLKVEITELKKDNNSFKDNMVFYNRGYESFPIPIWEKVKRGNNFVLQYLNPSYVLEFGHEFNYDRYSYIGKTDAMIYSKDVADKFFKADLKVALTGIPHRGVEYVYDKNQTKVKLDIIKWRVFERNDTLVRGMSFRTIPD